MLIVVSVAEGEVEVSQQAAVLLLACQLQEAVVVAEVVSTAAVGTP